MHFERKKTRQNPFQLTLSETIEQNFKNNLREDFKLESISTLDIRIETNLLIVSLCNRIAHDFYNTGPLFLTSMDKNACFGSSQ